MMRARLTWPRRKDDKHKRETRIGKCTKGGINAKEANEKHKQQSGETQNNRPKPRKRTEKKVCVWVSTCFLIFDLLNPPNLKRERTRQTDFHGPELKKAKKTNIFHTPEKGAPKLTTNNQTQLQDMIAIQDSEDDTRGGGAHGPPLAFRESFWGTIAPRVPKHPPLQEPPPKNICPTPDRIRPWALKEKIPTFSRLFIHLTRLATTRQTNSRHNIP